MARMPDITVRADLPEDKRHIFDAIEEAQSRKRRGGLHCPSRFC